MNHPIVINVINSQTGIPQSSDGIMMLFMKGVAVANTLVLDTPYLLTKLSDAAALGITAAYDVTNNTAVYQQISEFYAQAGDGTLLWFVATAKGNAYASYVAGATFQGLVRYTSQADPALRAKMIGFGYDVPAATQSASDFPADVTATLTALQLAQANLFKQGYQFSAILDGYQMSDVITPATLGTMANKAASSISLCITGSKPNGVSSIGNALALYAKIGLGESIGRVARGPVAITAAYLTNGATIPVSGALVVGKVYTVLNGAITYNSVVYQPGQTFTAVTGQLSYTTTAAGYVVTGGAPIASLTPSNSDGTGDIDLLGSKQFLFLRPWFNHSGFYYNDGATCTDPTLLLALQENNRIANALSADALTFFINQIGSQEAINTKTGNVDSTVLTALQQQFYNKYINPLTAANGNGSITDASIVVTGVNFNATKTLNFTLTVVAAPALGGVSGTVTFSSTL